MFSTLIATALLSGALWATPALIAFSAPKADADADADATLGLLSFTLQGGKPLDVTFDSSNTDVIDPTKARFSSGCGTNSLNCTLTLAAGNARGQSATVTATDPSGTAHPADLPRNNQRQRRWQPVVIVADLLAGLSGLAWLRQRKHHEGI
ncbi:MAG: hypothetical protein WCB49_03615 [Gammaproteobacteria bacterium]